MDILAIDPGSEKCGYAFLGKLLNVKGIIATPLLAEFIQSHLTEWKPEVVLLGDGTFSKKVKQLILPLLNQTPLVVVDEHDSTYRARRLYFQEHPPRGLWKMIPLGLQVPPVPYDDFAALLLAQRYMESKGVK